MGSTSAGEPSVKLGTAFFAHGVTPSGRLSSLLAWPWVDTTSVCSGFAVGYGALRITLYPVLATTQALALLTGLVLALGYAELTRAADERLPAHLTGAFMPETAEPEKKRWTSEELVAEAVRRFGDEARTWAFVCPACKDVADASDFLMAGADPNRVGTCCVGRFLGALEGGPTRDGGRSRASRGCDWTASGLISGPWTVEVTVPAAAPGEAPVVKTMSSFRLAEAPRVRSAHELAPVREAWEARFAAAEAEQAAAAADLPGAVETPR